MFTSYTQPGSRWQGATSVGEGAGRAGSKSQQLLHFNSGHLCARTRSSLTVKPPAKLVP